MTETVILNFEIDQGQAITQLKETEKTIISLKEEQKELNKAYKEGEISQEDYIEENIKLQQSLKKEGEQKKTLIRSLETESNSRNAMRQRVSSLTKEYNSLNLKTEEGRKRSEVLAKELKKLNNELNTGSKAAGSFKDNIGNYAESIKEAAGNTNIAGVSIGDLAGKFAGLANPITAAVGVLGALTTAYASSAVGARDLEYAQNLLGTSVQLLINDFGDMVSAGEKGEGIFSRLARAASIVFSGFTNTAVSDYIAQQKDLLKTLELSAAQLRGFAKEDERNAEFQRRIRDDETKSLDERMEASRLVEEFMKSSGARRMSVLQAEIPILEAIAKTEKDRRATDIEIASKASEIKDIQEEITGKLTENDNVRKSILATSKEQAELDKANAKAMGRQDDGSGSLSFQSEVTAVITAAEQIQDVRVTAAMAQIGVQDRLAKDMAKINKGIADDEIKQQQRSAEFAAIYAQSKLNAAQNSIDNIASLFEEQSEAYKFLAISQNFIDTYRAATAALSPPPTGAGPLFGPILAATTIAAGTANAARIQASGFAEGGFTGFGFGSPDSSGFKPAGIVHEQEYVVPKHVNLNPAAQGHISALEGMRLKGYADGGIVSSSITSPINAEFAMVNALKNMPPAEVSVVEVSRFQKRITLRERSTKI